MQVDTVPRLALTPESACRRNRCRYAAITRDAPMQKCNDVMVKSEAMRADDRGSTNAFGEGEAPAEQILCREHGREARPPKCACPDNPRSTTCRRPAAAPYCLWHEFKNSSAVAGPLFHRDDVGRTESATLLEGPGQGQSRPATCQVQILHGELRHQVPEVINPDARGYDAVESN